MRSTLCVLGMLLAATAAVAADRPQKDKSHAAQEHGAASRDSGTVVTAHVTFSTHDAGLVREYDGTRQQNLPPGLRKKLARGGTLPPGWQKRMEPMPVALERELVVLPAGYHRGIIDGHAVIYKNGSSVMFDVAVLF